MDWLDLVFALLVILGGAQLFTNGVEWIGESFGLSEGAVGSVLAAIGTALPETMLPLVAILGGGAEAGREVGIGAILGAPFMLSTLAMFVVGLSALVFARGGRRGQEVHAAPGVIRQDLAFFLGMYPLALLAGIWHVRPLHWALAAGLLLAYALYVRRHFRAPGEQELQTEAAGEVQPLYLWTWFRRMLGRSTPTPPKPPIWASISQTVVALVLIVGGARIFVVGVEDLAKRFGVPSLVFALLVAPVATELPEQLNGVLWIRRRKDTLALGNVTGAMVFQSSFPVSVGLLFTPWRLDADGLISGVIAVVAGAVIYAAMRLRGRLNGWMMLAQAAFFAGYVAYVLVRLR